MKINVTFTYSGTLNKDTHPVGEELALELEQMLREELGQNGTIDNWRDTGWSIEYTIDDAPVRLAFVYADEEPYDFYLQVAATSGFIQKILKKTASKEQEQRVIQLLYKILTESDRFSEIYWHDYEYNESSMTSEP